MVSRRSFLRYSAAAATIACAQIPTLSGQDPDYLPPLREFTYRDVELAPGPAQTQFEQTQSVLLSLNEDSLLKPWRLRAGLPAPGPELGGWYDEVPLEKTPSGGHGFAPAHSFGQWLSALARGYNANRDPATKAKLVRLLELYEPAISSKFYTNFRFPAYDYDKVVIGLIDAHQFADLPQTFTLLQRTTDAAEPHLPPHALDRDEPQRAWRKSIGENTENDYCWDESYTLPENLYLAWRRGAGERYRILARRFLLDRTYFNPLSQNKNVLANHHAYSFCNALSSAMQAYLCDNSEKHLAAAGNAFEMITTTQSFATGGWGPQESFVAPDSGGLSASLTKTHAGFETPCGSYAHFKLTRYLLQVSRDGRYGDSMERVLYNTVLGAKQLEPDGHAFYYSDYHLPGKKTYFPDKWPCCSGTLPQVAADYRILIYFRDDTDLFVNLYLPSTVRWVNADGVQLSLTQTSNYPLEGLVNMRVRTSKPATLGLWLRIPSWSSTAVVSVNGQRVKLKGDRGFAYIHRRWKDGDTIQLDMDLPMRLEPIDPGHPTTVALTGGPLVLFAISDRSPEISADQLLAATRVSGQPLWRAQTGAGTIDLKPFTAIQDETYMTYIKLAS
jgi:hypothetical protein